MILWSRLIMESRENGWQISPDVRSPFISKVSRNEFSLTTWVQSIIMQCIREAAIGTQSLEWWKLLDFSNQTHWMKCRCRIWLLYQSVVYPFRVHVKDVLSAVSGPESARQCEWRERLLLTGFGGVLSKMRFLLAEPHNKAIVWCW